MNQLTDLTLRAPWARIVLTGVFIGVLDLAFAIAFWALRGVPPLAILQSVATGWYGRDAFSMGPLSAGVGVASHFAIAVVIAACCALFMARLRGARRTCIAVGLAYGAVVFIVMNFLVPLVSRASPPSFADTGWICANLGMHLLIGLICAWLLRSPSHGNDLRRSPGEMPHPS